MVGLKVHGNLKQTNIAIIQQILNEIYYLILKVPMR